MKNLINELETLNETGELDEFKERLGNALTLIVETLINLLDLLIENKETILDIVEVLISFKLGAFAANTALGALSGTMKTFESVTTSAYAILNQFSFALTAMAAVGVYEFNQVKLAEQELIGSTKQVIKENENLVKSYNKNDIIGKVDDLFNLFFFFCIFFGKYMEIVNIEKSEKLLNSNILEKGKENKKISIH